MEYVTVMYILIIINQFLIKQKNISIYLSIIPSHLMPMLRFTPVLPHKVRTQYVYSRLFQIAIIASYFLFPWRKSCRNEQTINSLSKLKTVSTISNMCKYNFLTWEWIKVKMYVRQKYLLCFVNAHTAFLLCTAAFRLCTRQRVHMDTVIFKYLPLEISVRDRHYVNIT